MELQENRYAVDLRSVSSCVYTLLEYRAVLYHFTVIRPKMEYSPQYDSSSHPATQIRRIKLTSHRTQAPLII